MAKFTSNYKQLGFYSAGCFYQFADGVFETDDEGLIETLTQMTDAQRVDKPEEAPKAPKKSSKK